MFKIIEYGRDDPNITEAHNMNIREIVKQITGDQKKAISNDEYFALIKNEQKAINKIYRAIRKYNDDARKGFK